MKLELLYPKKLTDREVDKLKRYTFTGTGEYPTGELAEWLEKFRHSRKARVIRLTDDLGRILSWGLVFPQEKNWWELQLYTRRDVRERGYGTLVYNKAVQVAHGRYNLGIRPHDPISDSFFDKTHFDDTGRVRESKKRKVNASK